MLRRGPRQCVGRGGSRLLTGRNRNRRAESRRRGVEAMRQARRQALLARFGALGFESIDAAVAGVAAMTVAAAAAHLGVGRTTIRRWRRESLAPEALTSDNDPNVD